MFHSKTYYSVLILLIFVNLSSCDFEDLCDVENDCVGKAAGTLIQDPLDCHRFYECILDTGGQVIVSDALMSCPNGKYFDEQNQNCTNETFHCSNKCSNLFCPETCDGLPDGTLIAYPYDCNTFEICQSDASANPIYGYCNEDIPYFNGTHCGTDIYACCNVCTPYCEFAYTQVEDPRNCNYFYLCEEDDYIPGSLAHYECPEGSSFDRSLGECVEGYNCTTVCFEGLEKK